MNITKGKKLHTRNNLILASGTICVVSTSIFSYIGFLAWSHIPIFFDSFIINSVYMFRNPTLTPIMFFFSYAGREYLFVLMVLFYSFLAWKRKFRDIGFYGLIMCIGLFIYTIALGLVRRERPHYLSLTHEYAFSFPSGHTMHSFIFYACVLYYLYRTTNNKKRTICFGILFFIIIFMTAFSRIYLGVHYPSDVLAGFSGGIAVFSGILSITYLPILKIKRK